MTYKFVERGQPRTSGACINLSSAGILFVADRNIAAGKALEICLHLNAASTPPMTAFIEVVRSTRTNDGYEIGASIKGIKGN